MTYDEIVEGLAYGSIALLCDIGGTVGLLLGASVLTIFEFIEIWSDRLMRRCYHSRPTNTIGTRRVFVSWEGRMELFGINKIYAWGWKMLWLAKHKNLFIRNIYAEESTHDWFSTKSTYLGRHLLDESSCSAWINSDEGIHY